MSIIKHIENRKLGLTRIFQKHGIDDVQVSAKRMPVPGTQNDEAHMFEVYKAEMNVRPRDVIYLDDFRKWLGNVEQHPDSDGLFLTLSRELTDAEFGAVKTDLVRFIAHSESHGIDIKSPALKVRLHIHGT